MAPTRDREVYPNAAVVLVAVEVRHSTAPPLSRSSIAKIKQHLSPELPLLRPTTFTTVETTLGGTTDVHTERATRYMSRDRTAAVTFRNEALVIETTRYGRYEQLRGLVALALNARQSVDPIDSVERLGLRYINEIRVPEAGSSAASWEPWVDKALLGPAPIGHAHGLEATQLQGLVLFSKGEDKSLVLRYGLREGYAVDPSGDLKRSTPTPGPFFLLDIDSFWSATGALPEAQPETLLKLCDALNDPVRSLFEDIITERLRKEVLRHGG